MHLRAKRRGKGGKYKKNGEQENKLEQSEVKKKEIFRDCERITISCRRAYFSGWVSSEAHSLQPWGGGWLVQCLPWGQPRGHPKQGNNTHMALFVNEIKSCHRWSKLDLVDSVGIEDWPFRPLSWLFQDKMLTMYSSVLSTRKVSNICKDQNVIPIVFSMNNSVITKMANYNIHISGGYFCWADISSVWYGPKWNYWFQGALASWIS